MAQPLEQISVGSIVLWGTEYIPVGYQLCDGTNGTPDLRGYFVRGAVTSGEVLATGGVSTHKHQNPASSVVGNHQHTISGGITDEDPNVQVRSAMGADGAVYSTHRHPLLGQTSADGSHSHTIPDTAVVNNLPPHIKLYYIMRMS